MCQGCQDMLEYERTVDAYLMAELPKMLAQPIDWDVINGKPTVAPECFRP